MDRAFIYIYSIAETISPSHTHSTTSTSSFIKVLCIYQSVNMKVTAAPLILAGLVAANPVEVQERQSCPKVHIFGARETTAPAGYGTAGGLVNQCLSAFPGSTAEAISYPACGGQSQCGGVSYDNSASQGTAAVVKAVTALNQRCPSTQIILIGYSQVRPFSIL
jgi:acetylxylan esterase